MSRAAIPRCVAFFRNDSLKSETVEQGFFSKSNIDGLCVLLCVRNYSLEFLRHVLEHETVFSAH